MSRALVIIRGPILSAVIGAALWWSNSGGRTICVSGEIAIEQGRRMKGSSREYKIRMSEERL